MDLEDVLLVVVALVLAVVETVSLVCAIAFGIAVVASSDWRDAVLHLCKFIVFCTAFVATYKVLEKLDEKTEE